MSPPSTYLADKSAFSRHATRPEVRERIGPLLVAGQIATCGVIDLELLYSAPSPQAYLELAVLLRSLPHAPMDDAVLGRALEVQGRLAERSQHRAVSLPDLMIAACAEQAGLSVLHYDADFDRIAEVTGQPTQSVVPRGSVS